MPTSPVPRPVLLLAAALLTLLTACGVGAPTVDRSSLPRIDPATELAKAAPVVSFSLRAPAMPPDWIAQSSDVVALGPDGAPVAAGQAPPSGATRAVRVGWVTPEDGFARLVQSDAEPAAVVISESGDPAPTGTVTAGGRPWTTYTGRRDEAVWVTDVDGVRLLITGSAPPARFTQLAEATLAAPYVTPPAR